jgi:hypothetical protein
MSNSTKTLIALGTACFAGVVIVGIIFKIIDGLERETKAHDFIVIGEYKECELVSFRTVGNVRHYVAIPRKN